MSVCPSQRTSVPGSVFGDKDSGAAIEFLYNSADHGGKHYLNALPDVVATAMVSL